VEISGKQWKLVEIANQCQRRQIILANRLKLDPRGSQSVQTAAFFALVLMAAAKPAGEKKKSYYLDL